MGKFSAMKLAQYIADNNISLERFASEMGGLSVSGVRKWMNGDRTPRPDQMRKIAEMTGGVVQPNDFILIEAAE